MRIKRFFAVATAVVFLAGTVEDVLAQRGGSSSRGSSGGSSSRGSSGGSRFGGSSGSSRGSSGGSSGRSSSSGGSSGRSSGSSGGSRFGGSSGPSRGPSGGSFGGSSSSGGSSGRVGGSSPSGPRFGGAASAGGSKSSPAAGPRFGGSNSGGKSGGSATPPASAPRFGGSAGAPKFGGASSGPTAPASKSTGGSSKSAVPPPTFTGPAPKVNQVGAQAAKARAQDASRASKAAAEAPKVVKSASGKSYAVPPTVTSRVTPDYARTRSTRVTRVYNVNHYGGWSYHPYQSDPFHPMLTGYLLGRLGQPAYYEPTRSWVYANYDAMDPVRREELFRENSQLRDDIARMRANSVPVQQVSLDGMDPDLLYSDQAAQALYVPTRPGPSFWRVAGWVTLVGMVGFFVWAVFNVKSEYLGKWGQ